MQVYPRRSPFRPIHRVLVPVFYSEAEAGEAAPDAANADGAANANGTVNANGAGARALETSLVQAARTLAPQVIVVGIVRVASDDALSAAASSAQVLRSQLNVLAGEPGVSAHSQVFVSTAPLADLQRVTLEVDPDLLLLDWERHPALLGETPAQILSAASGPVALLRGPLPASPARILVPIRGGPHAILAMRLGLALHAAEQVVLHLTSPEQTPADEGPFLGLRQILPQLAGVTSRTLVTAEPAQVILDEGRDYDVVILGATARPSGDTTSLGPVADRVLNEVDAAVLVVRSRAPAPLDSAASGDQWEAELSGSQAISILVDKWFAEFTFDADEFADIERLVARKQEQGLTISLALPALNEQSTVGTVLGTIQRALMEEYPLLDEIVLIDSNSSDNTRAIATAMGIPVHIHQQLLPRLGARRGKGEALWKSLLVTRGDIVAWIDTDIVNIHPRFVYGILGPLLANPAIHFVKGFYRRPISVDGTLQEGGGRVTELMARPLINLFYPELSGVLQPLSGEYAGRRSALEAVRFYSGYGVETGLLIDIFERYGLSALAQVDLRERIHHNQPLGALSRMSFAILQVVMESLEKRLGVDVLADVNKTMKQIRSDESGYSLVVEEIAERWRPPMATIEEYRRGN